MSEFNINELEPLALVEHEKVKASFITTYAKIHKVSPEDATVIYDRESLYYKKALAASDKLKKATKISLYSSFLEAAITGLSLQPGQKSEAYLEARNFNKGNKDKPQWVSVCNFVITAYGELNMRMKAGQIVRMSNPIVLFEGDHFQPMTNAKGELYVDYKPAIPRKSNKIFGSYVAIHLPGGQIDFKWLLQDDISRLKGYSEKGFNSNANALYTSNEGQIDVGFLETKTIKHAMRAYTKLRVGPGAAYEDDVDHEKDSNFAPPAEPQKTITYGKPENGSPKQEQEYAEMEDDNDIF